MCGAGGERQAERESCVCCLRLCLLLCLCLCLCCCLSLPKNNNVNYELMRLYMCVCVRLLPVCINILKRAVCLSIKSSNDDDGSMTHPFIAQQIQTVTHTHIHTSMYKHCSLTNTIATLSTAERESESACQYQQQAATTSSKLKSFYLRQCAYVCVCERGREQIRKTHRVG